jgi:hypothetical protein
MPAIVVNVDTSRVEQMLASLDRKAQDLVLTRCGEKALKTVSGIPVDTGELAASPRVEVGGTKEPGVARLRIVSDVEYAKFVFGGHQTRGDTYVDPVPPKIGYSAQDLANDVADELGLTR